MDQQTQALAEAAARLLLRQYREAHPEWDDDKTPLDELVQWLGLEIATFHPEDYPAGTYGFVDADEDEHLIWLRQDLGETFRRFTLAHELGHAVLHCEHNTRIQGLLGDLGPQSISLNDFEQLPTLSRLDPCAEHDVQEELNTLFTQERIQEFTGSREQYDPRSQRELAANIFAAELLLPLERVRSLYLEHYVHPGTLVAKFGVSHTALLNRLANLLKTSPPPENQRLQLSPDTPKPVQKAKKTYDEFQQAALETETPALIVAGPGSGKTSTLIGRVEYLINTLHIPPQRILALTFSRKATQEMEERLEGVLAGPLPRVSTFHAFCADLLRKHGSEVGLRPGFTLIDEAEGYFLLRQQANHLRLRHYQKLQAPAYYFPDMLKAISRAKDELIPPEAYTALAQRMLEQAITDEALQQAEKALEVAQAYTLYEEALQRRGDSDFGGLLLLAVRLLRERPEIRQEQQELYQHILVDEFQDVNRASGVLLRELAGDAQRVWVVGDANQAIYGFRGASPANIKQFTHDFLGAHILPLSRNYRSRPDLVTLAEAFRCAQLERDQEPGKNLPIRLTQPETYVTLAQATDERCELAGLAADIKHKHAQGHSYKDMIVLCRTRSHARKISRALNQAGLPVIERGGMLEQEQIKDILSIILLLVEPSGTGLLRMARQSEHPITQTDIEALLLAAREQQTNVRALLLTGELPPTISVEGRSALNRLSAIMHALLHAPDIWSLLAQYLMIETGLIRQLLLSAEQKQASTLLMDYTNLLQVARHYDQQQQQRFKQQVQEAEERGEPLPDEPVLEERLKDFLEYLSLLVLLRQDGSRQGAEDEDEERNEIIRVMTVHASKGLEFPIVYMPGLVERRFPSQMRSSPVSAPEGMLAEENTGKAAHESGEACLFYVGVTRARDQLILSYSERYGKLKYKRALYLDALEAGLDDTRFQKVQWDQSPQAAELVAEESEPRQSSQPSPEFIKAVQPPVLKASAIEAYQRCPRQYAYSALYGFGSASDGYQLFWQATQRTLDTLRQQLQSPTQKEQRALPTQAEIQELYSKNWQEIEGHTSPFGRLYEEHGHEVVELIRRELLAQEERRWEMRPSYSVDVGGKAVQVTVDRVEASTLSQAQPARFVRTRFGQRKEKPSAEMREFFYALAYRQLHPGHEVELHSHNMSTGEIVPIKLTTKKEQSLYDEVEQSIRGLEEQRYPAEPAEPFRCPTCPFFLICPA